MAALERIELDGGMAVRHRLRGRRGELLRGGATREPAVAVEGEPVVEAAAEQVVDRQAERLAAQVPEGDVHAADQGGDEAERAERVEAGVELVPEIFDARRVLADEQRADPAGGGGDHGAVRPGGDLADAMNAGVGVDAEEDPRIARAGEMIGRHAGNLHRSPSVHGAMCPQPYSFHILHGAMASNVSQLTHDT